MTGTNIFKVVLAGAALAAGLGAAVYLRADSPDKARPRDVAVRVAYAAPEAGGDRPAVAYYQAELRDLTRATDDLVSPLEFTTVAGPVDSHVIWLMVEYYHTCQVRVRGVSATGAPGLWSPWSNLYENQSPWQTPEPPGD